MICVIVIACLLPGIGRDGIGEFDNIHTSDPVKSMFNNQRSSMGII
ncbi:MAG: hypothetical protein H0U95_05990 [Bacteroidetes bacterium]|nr:hypothetical protein [Bacteroidota bacterium]